MFTGLIEALGTVRQISSSREGKSLTVQASSIAHELRLGDSIAIDGACLSVTATDKNQFTVLAVPETLQRTTLGSLRIGEPVNLERALAANQRFQGHFVQGHIDCTARICAFQKTGAAATMTIEIPPDFDALTVEKGSIAINGVSLTIAQKRQQRLTIALIPLTLAHSNLGKKVVGDRVNVEFDILAKYVANMLNLYHHNLNLTEIAEKWGFEK